MTPSNPWNFALELNESRQIQRGSPQDLTDAIRRGADLRVMTEFLHGEHVDTTSDSDELIREVCDFQITYLVDHRWTAGIMNARQPVELPTGFGARPSMSFFLYNQDGEQALARPFMDGRPATGQPGSAPAPDHLEMPKYHQHDNWDAQTNAPSQNFVYDFGVFRYLVRDDWQQVLEHNADGSVESGSVDTLAEAFSSGRQVKIAVRGLCDDLGEAGHEALEHEVFVRGSSCYYYTRQKLFVAGTDPVVRVRPAIPLSYGSRMWDVAWLLARTDGVVILRRLDPYTFQFHDQEGRYGIRWFVR